MRRREAKKVRPSTALGTNGEEKADTDPGAGVTGGVNRLVSLKA